MMHKARKRFGQNFLHDTSVIASIIASAAVRLGEHWVEIGPGLGALTQPLLKTGATLDVVELDRDLAGLLAEKFAHVPQFTLHSADALNFDFCALAAPGEKLRIIGNLPYNISTPLLFHLLDSAHCIQDMHFMLQKEVVTRLCAEPGGKDYGKLSVMAQYRCQPTWLFDVPPESFSPVPKVLSAIIRLQPHTQPPVAVHDEALFGRVVTEAFSQRRKTLRNALGKSLSAEQIESAGVNPSARAETLTLDDFARLSHLLSIRH